MLAATGRRHAVTDNVLPRIGVVAPEAARSAIREAFLTHVIGGKGLSRGRGFSGLVRAATPDAVLRGVEVLADVVAGDVLVVDVGGATTDVFSVFGGTFNRTVSANLGMSYSISKVCAEAGMQNVLRWVHVAMDERELRNRVKNKMIRPTTIPQTYEDLLIEHAVSREALRLAFEHHKSLALPTQSILQMKLLHLQKNMVCQLR